MANIPLQSITFPGLSDKYTTLTVDATLTQTGAAADAKKTGDEISGLKNDFQQLESAFVVETETGAIASFTDGADDVSVKDLTVAIEPVQSGSGDPSPSNVRPISGWTGANVTRTGKNLLDKTVFEKNYRLGSDGTPYYEPDYYLSPFILVTPNTTYTRNIALNVVKSVCLYDANKNFITRIATGGTTFTTTASTYYIRTAVYQEEDLNTVQLELGSTTTAYEPYQGETYEVDWTAEAGTVYGGTLDVTTGVLTVDRGYIASYNGETLPSTWISDRDVYASGATPTTGSQVVYKLATPQTYQLTPQEVSTVLGKNNIFADTGNVTVQYRADTKLYIDKVLNA